MDELERLRKCHEAMLEQFETLKELDEAGFKFLKALREGRVQSDIHPREQKQLEDAWYRLHLVCFELEILNPELWKDS